jgi:RNA polymerase sigma-70 factor (ECF subfamily)
MVYGDRTQSPTSPSTSTSLLDRVKLRDPDAWGRLVQVYGPLVYGWCRRTGLQGDDAADVAQEVFGVLVSRIADFRRDRPGDTFRGWLRTITRNKVNDHYRRAAHAVPGQGGSDANQRLAQVAQVLPETPDAEGDDADQRALDHRVVELVRAGVEPATWQAFWMVSMQGRPVAHVADELGMTRAAVYKAKYRVIRRLRQEFGDLPE